MPSDTADLYAYVWALPGYTDHSPGVAALPYFLAMTQEAGAPLAPPPPTVLDLGCGSGAAASALVEAGFDPFLTDLTDAGVRRAACPFPFVQADLTDPGFLLRVRRAFHFRPFDYVYCTDVLEHLPTEDVSYALAQVAQLGPTRGAFFAISLVGDAFGFLAGQPLHQTVRSFVWWKARLAKFFTVVEARDCLTTGYYWLT